MPLAPVMPYHVAPMVLLSRCIPTLAGSGARIAGNRLNLYQGLGRHNIMVTGDFAVAEVAECCRVVAAVALLADPELGSGLKPLVQFLLA